MHDAGTHSTSKTLKFISQSQGLKDLMN